MATKAEIVGQPMHRLPPDVTRVLLVRNLPYNIKVKRRRAPGAA